MSASIIRIGPFPDDNNCAKKLQSEIVDYYRRQEEATATETASSDTTTLRIANKYFTATVLLRDVNEKEATSNPETHNEDGIILVFDAVLSNPKVAMSISCSFDSLEQVHDTAVQRQQAGDLLRLCVGVGSRHELNLTEKEYEAEYGRRVLWCLDRGYEYAETDLLNVHEGHDDRDKEGFARIIEAISGTVWSTAVMNKKKQKELKRSYEADAANIRRDAEPLSTEVGVYEPPKLVDTEALLANVEKETAAFDDTNLSDSRRAEIEEERNFDALESSIQEARRIRELSQSGQLTDDERRQRASKAATLIYEMMGKMGFDTDDDSEEGDEDLAKEEKVDNS